MLDEPERWMRRQRKRASGSDVSGRRLSCLRPNLPCVRTWSLTSRVAWSTPIALMSSGPAASDGSRWRCGRPTAPVAARAPSVRATSAPAPNSHCLRTLSCFSFGRGASDAASRDTTRERWRSRGGLASPRISYARPFKQARADRQAARSCRAPAFDAPRVGRLRPGRTGWGSAPRRTAGRRGDRRGRRYRRRQRRPFRRKPVSGQRDVDLVREPVERRRPGADRAQGAPAPDQDRLHQELRWWRRMEPVHAEAWSSNLHSRGLRVCAWQFVYGEPSRRGGQARRAGGRARAPTAW